MTPHARLAHLLPPLAVMWACMAPEGPAPAPPGQPPRDPAPAPDPDTTADIVALPLPDRLPATVWTRTAPVSLVDEHGAPLAVLQGHHTRLTLLHTWGVRAEVRCDLCPTSIRGWVQARLLLPEGHQASAQERADARLALALAAADLRSAVVAGDPLGGRALDPATQAVVLGILDQGFAEREGEALAPSFGEVYARQEGSILLRREASGWAFAGLDLQRRD